MTLRLPYVAAPFGCAWAVGSGAQGDSWGHKRSRKEERAGLIFPHHVRRVSSALPHHCQVVRSLSRRSRYAMGDGEVHAVVPLSLSLRKGPQATRREASGRREEWLEGATHQQEPESVDLDVTSCSRCSTVCKHGFFGGFPKSCFVHARHSGHCMPHIGTATAAAVDPTLGCCSTGTGH